MMRFFFIGLFCLLGFGGSAQINDSLFVVRKGGNWAIKYVVKSGETAHMLATRFYISDGVLDAANDVQTMKQFSTGSVIIIPVTTENYYSVKQSFPNRQELYYHVGTRDDIGLISTYAGVTKAQMISWNNLHGNSIWQDEVLFVGWVKIMAFDTASPLSMQAYPLYKRRTAAVNVKQTFPGGLDSVFNRQTNNGVNVINEKGTAVFYEKTSKKHEYLAFHNATPPGSVIKVMNPGNGKFIYVRVIGAIPATRQYANCVIGISSEAKEALGVTDNKTWCELSYPLN
jgi:LysM repeat protein